MTVNRVLAIDPGRGKCGLAVVDHQLGVLRQAVVEQKEFARMIKDFATQYGCRVVVLGDGTAAEFIGCELEALVSASIIDKIESIDESESTRQARSLYWLAHPPSGWKKIIPVGLLIPPCAIDDFAAIILAERYFERNAKNS